MNMQLGAANRTRVTLCCRGDPDKLGTIYPQLPQLELADPFIKMNSKRSHVSRLSHMNDIYHREPGIYVCLLLKSVPLRDTIGKPAVS